MPAQKLRYITLSQFMSSVEDDFHKFSDAGLIDNLKLIKVIRACNEKLGIRLYRQKQDILHLSCRPGETKGRADLPLDFYKMEMAFALHHRFINTQLPIGAGTQQTLTEPILNQLADGGITLTTGDTGVPIVNTTGCCLDQSDTCTWLIKTPLTQVQVKYTELIPLHITSGDRYFTEYSPNRQHYHHHERKAYDINIEEGYIETHFQEGVIYISYLQDMKSETGEDLIPFHPLLNPYYEWSVKVKILQDILMNSEDDVINRLKYAERERNLSFLDAVNFAMGKEAHEWKRYDEERSRKFHQKYFSIFY